MTRLVLRGQRPAHRRARACAYARSAADRRRALWRCEHRSRLRGTGLVCSHRSRSPAPRACTWTWDTSAYTARSPTARTLPATARDSELFAALRTKDVPAIAELTARLAGRLARCIHARCRRSTARPTKCSPLRAHDFPTRRRSTARCRHWRRCANPRRRGSTRCTSTWRICAAITTRPAPASRYSPAEKPTPSAAASATMASARRSAGPGRRPGSRSTCVSSQHCVAREQ